MKNQRWEVRINSAQSQVTLEVIAYELMDLKAGVYHRLVFEDNVVLYVNDFGIRSILVKPVGMKLANPPSI